MKRFNLELSDNAVKILEELQKKTGKSKAELFRLGLGLLKYAEDSKKQKRFLAVVKDNKIEKEIVMP